jgi:hypothetical protein
MYLIIMETVYLARRGPDAKEVDVEKGFDGWKTVHSQFLRLRWFYPSDKRPHATTHSTFGFGYSSAGFSTNPVGHFVFQFHHVNPLEKRFILAASSATCI